MLKKNLKVLLTMFLIIIMCLSFSVCFAENEIDTTQNVTTQEETSDNESDEEIYNGDLYLFDTNVVMDKLVDGNVFILGETVEITGQINGNLFVCANKLTFNNCYVRYSVFACANSVYYNGACNDLYVASSDLQMTYDSYVVRDVKITSKDVIFKAAVGRDVDLSCKTVNFGEVKDNSAVIYGNLKYSAAEEANIPEGVISNGEPADYSKNSINLGPNLGQIIFNITIAVLSCIVTVILIYILTNKFTPKFAEKLSNKDFSVLTALKYFITGILTFIAVAIATFILLLTVIGAKLGLILILAFILLCFVSIPLLAIAITNVLTRLLKVEKKAMFYLILSLVSIVFYAITLIPYVGFILNAIIKLVAVGLLIDMFVPKKELSDNEKEAIKKAKLEKKKLKEQKKLEKKETKETKKKDNNK